MASQICCYQGERLQFNYSASPYAPSQFDCNGLTLLDGAGLPYYTSSLDSKLLRLGSGEIYCNSSFLNTFTWFPFLFSEDPAGSQLEGDRGDLRITNNWRLQFTPINTLSTGAELVVLALRLCVVTLFPDGSTQTAIL